MVDAVAAFVPIPFLPVVVRVWVSLSLAVTNVVALPLANGF